MTDYDPKYDVPKAKIVISQGVCRLCQRSLANGEDTVGTALGEVHTVCLSRHNREAQARIAAGRASARPDLAAQAPSDLPRRSGFRRRT